MSQDREIEAEKRSALVHFVKLFEQAWRKMGQSLLQNDIQQFLEHETELAELEKFPVLCV